MKNLKTYFNMVITAVVCLLSAGIVKLEDVLSKEKRVVRGALAGNGLNGTMPVGVLLSDWGLCRKMVAGRMLQGNEITVFMLPEKKCFEKAYQRKKLPHIQMAVCRGSP